MNVRSRSLPAGWYPASAGSTRREIEGFRRSAPESSVAAVAGVAPHAGWSFSGSVACHVIQSLKADCETVVVIGGHLMPHSGLMAAFEQGYETPLGVLPADLDLLDALRSSLAIKEDRQADNTVEVQLPLVRHLHPSARGLYLRAAPSEEALRLGEELSAAADRLRRKLTVLGSTDLTHYGDMYGFAPRGGGEQAVQWVKEVNDRRILDALVSMRLQEALHLAVSEQSACSAGGAVAAARFAQLRGADCGRLLEYRTSYDLSPGSFFVGYGGIIYPESG